MVTPQQDFRRTTASRKQHFRRLFCRIAVALLCIATLTSAADALGFPGKNKGNTSADKSKATPPEEALKSYIQRVRTQHDAEVRTPGAIWIEQGRLVRL